MEFFFFGKVCGNPVMAFSRFELPVESATYIRWVVGGGGLRLAGVIDGEVT